MTGTIKSYGPMNYGFVTANGVDFFFMDRDCDFIPERGMTVVFEPIKTEKGMRAKEVRNDARDK